MSNFRIHLAIEDLDHDRGVGALAPVRRAAAAAVMQNPWLPLQLNPESLQAEVAELAPELALLLTGHLLKALGGVERIEAFGKAAIVGLHGEIEHSAALLHTPYFGNVIREQFAATEFMTYAEMRAPAGTPIVVPMVHKTSGGRRTHFMSVPLLVPGTPAPDEIVVAVGAATGGRPNARIGDRTTDPAVYRDDFRDHPLFEWAVS